MKRLILPLLAATAVLAGCASTSSDVVTAKTAAALAPYVQALRVAASGSDTSRVRAAVTALDNEVDKLQESGKLTAQRAQDIENQAASLQSEFAHLNRPTPTITPTTPTATPTTTTPTPTPTVTVTITPTTPATTPDSTPPSPPTSP